MSISDRNKILSDMALEINKKQQYLQERYKEISKNKLDNKYLESIYLDYKNYFDYINNIKKEQLEAFQKISYYLDNVGNQLKTTDHLLEETKKDQFLVLNQINKIRNELNNTINN